MSEIIQAGNTVRLNCSFYDVNGVLANPSIVKITLYDYRYTKLEEIILGDMNRSETGKYFYDLKTDLEEKRYIYEWQGIINGFPSIKRDDFKTEFL